VSLLTSTVEVFAREIITALTHFNLLDSYFDSIPRKRDAAVRPMAEFYLERRVLNERHGATILLQIRNIAAQLCRESSDERNELDYIRLLCPIVVETRKAYLKPIWDKSSDPSWTRLTNQRNLPVDVYLAALGTQALPVAERRLSSGEPMDVSSWYLDDARVHAAKYGSHEVLAAIMASCDDSGIQALRMYLLQKAALFGRVEATKFVFDFQATERPWVFSSKGPRHSDACQNLDGLWGMHTPSREILDFLTEKRKLYIRDRIYGAKYYSGFLVRCAQEGWVDMAAHCLSLGAKLNGTRPQNPKFGPRPLVVACIHGREEIVELLLAHGVDTSQPALQMAVRHGHFAIVSLLVERDAELGEALVEAVAKGYRTIVRTLLEHYTSAKPEWQDLLVSAVKVEDEALFGLLVGYTGGVIDEATRAVCEKVASEKGLESMLGLVSTAATVG
jgi:hypothetical protein